MARSLWIARGTGLYSDRARRCLQGTALVLGGTDQQTITHAFFCMNNTLALKDDGTSATVQLNANAASNATAEFGNTSGTVVVL